MQTKSSSVFRPLRGGLFGGLTRRLVYGLRHLADVLALRMDAAYAEPSADAEPEVHAVPEVNAAAARAAVASCDGVPSPVPTLRAASSHPSSSHLASARPVSSRGAGSRAGGSRASRAGGGRASDAAARQAGACGDEGAFEAEDYLNPKARAMTQVVIDYVRAHYDVRYNVLDRQPELRARAEGTEAPFRPADRYRLNSLFVELRLKGCDAWSDHIAQVLSSRVMPQYHPFRAYMAGLPAWDGTDRVTPLARRISGERLWLNFFATWLRAMAAQWEGRKLVTGNQCAPILVSRRQGLRKSTFCRLLLPPELRAYYTDKFDLTSHTDPTLKLYDLGLVNMDEFDRYTPRQLTRLKNLMQFGDQRLRSAYARQATDRTRLASLIGTSNRTELLHDPTGSRRFYCQEVTEAIDCDTPIDYPQLFAQLRAELDEGRPTWFDAEAQTAIEAHNAAYYAASPLEDAFDTLFRSADRAEAAGQWLTATEIFTRLRRAYGSALRLATVSALGSVLTRRGVTRRRMSRGTEYRVIALVCGEVKELRS